MTVTSVRASPWNLLSDADLNDNVNKFAGVNKFMMYKFLDLAMTMAMKMTMTLAMRAAVMKEKTKT